MINRFENQKTDETVKTSESAKISENAKTSENAKISENVKAGGEAGNSRKTQIDTRVKNGRNTRTGENAKNNRKTNVGENTKSSVKAKPDEDAKNSRKANNGENAKSSRKVNAGENAKSSRKMNAGENVKNSRKVNSDENAKNSRKANAGENAKNSRKVNAGENVKSSRKVNAGENVKNSGKARTGEKVSFREKAKNSERVKSSAQVKSSENAEITERVDIIEKENVREMTASGENGKRVEKVKIIPLGGLDKIGMNITAIEYGNTIVVVDCGISFPDDDMLGIDKVIPDVTYLVQNREKVKGFVITHGHEDHIGALPYILPQINVPVYATKLTMGLIEHKLEEAKLMKKTKRKVVNQGSYVNLGEIRVEFIKTNHSIAGASALAIYTPAGIIFHTGDFKVDYTPLFGEAIDLQRMGIIGKKGVLAVMCDSTNAMRPGFTPSETKVAKTFDTLFAENTGNRIIVATFASNVDRVQQIMNTAYKYGRKVILQGRSMETVIKIAEELGYLTVPKNTLIEIDRMKNYPKEKLVLITTGSQGEAMAALSRMADSTHKKVTIKPDDAIIFSSTPIPGNEKAVSRVVNELAMKGANVIYQDTHVSGHACQEEIKLIYSLLKPKYAIPAHGEYRHLLAGANLAKEVGVDKDNVFILEAGDVLELSEEKGSIVGKVPARGIFVDGLGVGDVGNVVIRDRQNLSENGIIIVSLGLEKGSNRLVSGPDIISRGFVYVRESEQLMNELRSIALKALEKCENQNCREWGRIKNEIRDSLEDYLWKKIKRSPMILPVILEV